MSFGRGPPVRTRSLRDPEPDQDDGRQTDRHIDPEDVAPTVVGTEEGDQCAAEDRPGRTGHRDGGAEVAERHAPLGSREELLDQAGALGGEQTGRHALDQAGEDHPSGGRGQTDGSTGDDEGRQSDQEHDPATVDIAQPAARHQYQAEAERVARHDPLDGLRRGLQPLLDRRNGDVHDGDVQQSHEADDQGDGQDPPAVGVWRRLLPSGVGFGRGHAPRLPTPTGAAPSRLLIER